MGIFARFFKESAAIVSRFDLCAMYSQWFTGESGSRMYGCTVFVRLLLLWFSKHQTLIKSLYFRYFEFASIRDWSAFRAVSICAFRQCFSDVKVWIIKGVFQRIVIQRDHRWVRSMLWIQKNTLMHCGGDEWKGRRETVGMPSDWREKSNAKCG